MCGVLPREGVGLLRRQRRGGVADLAAKRDAARHWLEDDPGHGRMTFLESWHGVEGTTLGPVFVTSFRRRSCQKRK